MSQPVRTIAPPRFVDTGARARVGVLVLAFVSGACGSRTGLEGLTVDAIPDAGVDAPLVPKTCTPDGLRRVLTAGLASPARMAVNGGEVFVTLAGSGDGRVVRVATKDGTADEIARGQNGPIDIVAERDNVFWLNAGEGALHAYARSFGTQRVVDDMLGVTLQGLAVDLAFLYVGNTNGPIRKIPKSPVERRDIVLVPSVQGTPAIATDDDRVYYLDASSLGLRSVDKLGNAPRTHTGGPGGALAVDGGAMFSVATDGTRATIRSQPTSGGRPTTVVTSSGDIIERLVVDADRVYFTEGITMANGVRWSVRAVPRVGGPPVTLADDTGPIADIGVDDVCAYWVERGAGASLVRVPKVPNGH